MHYSISTAITTILFASTLTTAIPVVQRSESSGATKVTLEFTGPSEKAVQDDILANGKPQAVSNDVQGVTDAEVLIDNGLNGVKCLAFDAQGMQISGAFALNKKAPLGGPAQQGGVDVAKVMCSTSGIAVAPSSSFSPVNKPTPPSSLTMSKRADAASSSAASGPTGAAGNKDSGESANSLDAPSATSDSPSGSSTDPAANKDSGAGDKDSGASGSATGEQGPEMTSMSGSSHKGTKSSGAGMDDGSGDAPFIRLAFQGLPDLERQQPIRADGANHDVRGAVGITEASIMDAHGHLDAKCQAFGPSGRLGEFTVKKPAIFNWKHGVSIKKVACTVDDAKQGGASPSAFTSGFSGPVITDPIEPQPTSSSEHKGMTATIMSGPGPEATGPFASGKGNGKQGGESSSSVMSGAGPEKTGSSKSVSLPTFPPNAGIVDGGNAKPTPSA